MKSVEYYWGTMYGTFLIDCKVISKKGDKYFIEFFDYHAEEPVRRWVEKTSLKFPEFGDNVI